MKEERHQKILDRLSDGEYVSVETLSRELFVSMPTIRRDLTAMQQMGLVMRSHGGVIRTTGVDAPPLAFRIGVKSAEKIRLAKVASQLLHDDSVVFLDESTTTLHIIEHLPKYNNIKVVTNSMSVLQVLYKYKIAAYCLGGEFARDTVSFYGRDTEKMVERFGIDLMFFSSSGINNKGWIVDYSQPSNSLRRQVLQQAETKVFLCDHSKVGKHGAYTLAHLSDMDYLVLEAPLPAGMNTGSAKIMYI